jgi:uncharacterized protein DUF5302
MSESVEQPASSEDDLHRKFREALERKQAKGKAAHGSRQNGGQGVGPSSNDKHQRQFRRKSGG